MNQLDFNNERILLEQIKLGSKEAFAFFFNKYYNSLVNYIFAISSSKTTAEEIAQETFIIFWEKRKKLSIKNNYLKAYLFKSAYYKFIDDNRALNKKYKLLEDLRNESYVELIDFDSSLKQEQIKNINSIIDSLPDRCKQIFIMSKIDGLKYKEISDRLEISVKTVEAQISKALKVLRSKLAIFILFISSLI
ncbi:MAG: ECF RNA polymerase sigma factor SigW [SAR116 cluster bacterium]|nr:MAG: ECF RNA polymerase sigma factor SigW [SAR116 cluster bacterium]